MMPCLLRDPAKTDIDPPLAALPEPTVSNISPEHLLIADLVLKRRLPEFPKIAFPASIIASSLYAFPFSI
jgi:hypothetical protein